jgi:hypothetical protein
MVLSLGIKLFIVVAIAVAAYYGWLYFQTNAVNKDIVNLTREIDDAQKTMNNTPEKQEVFTRQDQGKQLDTLVQNHVYWSHLFPEIAKATLKNSKYMNIHVAADGLLSMNVEVSSLQDLEKYLLVFDLAKFNKYFSNVHLSSLTQSQGVGTLAVRADIKMNFDPTLLKYNYDKLQASR